MLSRDIREMGNVRRVEGTVYLMNGTPVKDVNEPKRKKNSLDIRNYPMMENNDNNKRDECQ